jgi:hypothetical protein
MKIFAILSIILFIGHLSFGQDIHPTKSTLLKTFKKSIDQEGGKTINTYSNPWITDNKDSSYFKSDTIVFINFNHEFPKQVVCKPINWTFYKKNSFVLTSGDLCNEPTRLSTTNRGSWYRIRIFETKTDLILQIKNSDNRPERYAVLSITETVDLTVILTLIRSK